MSRTTLSVVASLAVGLTLGLTPSAPAQAIWTGNGATDNWGDAGNWTGLPPGTNPGQTLTFLGPNRPTPFNDLVSYTATGITFDFAAPAFTLAGNPVTLAGDLVNGDNVSAAHVSGAATQTVNQPVTFDMSAARAVNAFSGPITINGNLSSAGATTNTLTLGGPNSTFTSAAGNPITLAGDNSNFLNPIALGTTAIVRVTSPTALGSAAAGTTLTGAGSPARLELDNPAGMTIAEPFTIPGRNQNTNLNPGLLNVSGNNVLTGPLAFATTGGSVYVLGSNGGKLTIQSNLQNVSTSTRTFVLTGSGDAEVAGNVLVGSDTTNVRKEGTGTWTLSGSANTYAGTTAVNNGTLAVTGAVTGAGAATVAAVAGTSTAAGTLAGTGSIAGPVTVNAGTAPAGNGVISPGTAAGPIGALTLGGSLTLNGTYTADVIATANDRLDVLGNLSLGGSSLLNLPATNTYDGVTNYVLANYGGTLTGTFGNFPTGTEPGLPAGYTLNYGTGSNSAITLTPVPEPSGILLGSAAAAGLAWWPRRR